jgi:hypothetical protein
VRRLITPALIAVPLAFFLAWLFYLSAHRARFIDLNSGEVRHDIVVLGVTVSSGTMSTWLSESTAVTAADRRWRQFDKHYFDPGGARTNFGYGRLFSVLQALELWHINGQITEEQLAEVGERMLKVLEGPDELQSLAMIEAAYHSAFDEFDPDASPDEESSLPVQLIDALTPEE